jgi:hypothetical protein
MGKALADAFPICRNTFAEADHALASRSATIFEGPEDRLMLTENTLPRSWRSAPRPAVFSSRAV